MNNFRGEGQKWIVYKKKGVDRPVVKFLAIRNRPKKIKNPNFIKSEQKRNSANKKGHTSLFGLEFLDFKLVPIDLELNFALEN